jgi:hypothetical protein
MSDTKENTNMNDENIVEDNILTSTSNSKRGELLVIGGDEAIGRPGTASLQDNFKRFRDQKIRERQLMSQCRKDREGGSKRSQEFKDALREKFVEQAKKYIGVPYAERYKAPDAPVAPLYLDCCGLVRQCVQDLQEVSNITTTTTKKVQLTPNFTTQWNGKGIWIRYWSMEPGLSNGHITYRVQ